MLDRQKAIERIDRLSQEKSPFLFFTDFLGTKAWVKPIADIDTEEIQFEFHRQGLSASDHKIKLEKTIIPKEAFTNAYKYVIDQINFGNSYLVNLTFKTPVETSLSLSQIFTQSQAKYKLRYKDQFVFFSPETFIKVIDGNIYSYPMKGTIDASLPNAEAKLLSDPKEIAEHVTIVDLIRNDLSQVASKVEVTKFRYTSQLKTSHKNLLQVSSEIRGKLNKDYNNQLGSLIFKLLPAGSISGAPKKETVSIIEMAEKQKRGFYTGICGYFDGERLDSCVMIRFIEKENGQLYYRSGGGITSFSDETKEYEEMIDKIYIPRG